MALVSVSEMPSDSLKIGIAIEMLSPSSDEFIVLIYSTSHEW